jgi:integrase/recombinase XerD
LSLAAVRDLRTYRPLASPEELEQLEVDVLAGFVLARASAGVTDGTIRGDISHLEQLRAWFERPLWEMQPADADAYFGRVLRRAPSGTRLARSQALRTYFEFLELRHKVELHQLTGQIVACPIDELNRPRGTKDARLRIPPRAEELATFFAGWAVELATCRKFAPSARNYTAAKLMATVGLRVNEARNLDLADVKWELGPFGKLHVRHGKGARGSGRESGWCRCSTTPTGRCAGSSRTSGASSTTTTPATARRCCPPSTRTPTGRAAGSATTRCAPGWPPRPPPTCQRGRAG